MTNLKYLFSFVCFILSCTINSQTTEKKIKVTVPTKFGDFVINIEQQTSVRSTFDNKKQAVIEYSEVSSKTYVMANNLKITDKIKKDLADYKAYDEDINVLFTFNKTGKMIKYEFVQTSVLDSFNEFYKQLFDEILKKITPSQANQLIDLKTENSIRIKLTYTK